jgi:hypothetical protein
MRQAAHLAPPDADSIAANADLARLRAVAAELR